MRQLTVRVPRGHADEVLQAARAHGGVNLAAMAAAGEDGAALDLVLVQVPNPAVLVVLHVERSGAGAVSAGAVSREEIGRLLAEAVRVRLAEGFDAIPLVDVTVLGE